MHTRALSIIFCLFWAFAIAPAAPADDLYDEGRKLYDQGKYQEAVDKFKEAVRLDPNHGWAHFYLGLTHNYRWKKHAESLPYFHRAIQIMPEEPWPLVDTGTAYAAMKDFPQALAFYKKGIAKFEAKNQRPWDWVLTEVSSRLRGDLKRPAEAAAFMTDAIRKYGQEENPDLLLELAYACSDQKQYDRALSYYAKTQEAFAKSNKRPYPWSLLNPAAIYLFYKNPAEPERALPYLERCLSPDFTEEEKDRAVDWTAYAHYLLKNDPEFLRYANRYIDTGRDPETRKAQAGRVAEYYYTRGDLEKACRAAELQGKSSRLYRLLSVRKVDLTMEFHLQEIMGRHFRWARPGPVYFTLPRDSYYQKLLSLESSTPYMKIESEDGENAVCIDFTGGFPKMLTLTMKMQYRMTWALPEQVRFHQGSAGKNDLFAHKKSDYLDIDNEVFVSRVREITKDGKTPYEKIVAMRNWIGANVVYFTSLPEHKDATGNPDKWITFKKVSDIMTAKKGHCGHYSDLFTAMCRIENIPARNVAGIFIGDLDDAHPSYHIVSEVYEAPRDRWVYVEPQSFVALGNHSLHVMFTPDYQPGEKGIPSIDTIYLHHLEYYNMNNKKCVTVTLHP